MLDKIKDFIQSKIDTIALIITILSGAILLSNFLSNYYKLYNKLKQENNLVQYNFYQDDIRKIRIKLNDTEESILLNKSTLIEVKVKDKRNLGKEVEISCIEQIVK